MKSIRIKALAAVLSAFMLICTQVHAEPNVCADEAYESLVQADIECVARVLWHECRGMEVTDQSAVVWCILNRVDDERWSDTIQGVCKEPNQFAYHANAPLDEDLLWLAEDVITRWNREKEGMENVGRTLPNDYFFFAGHSGRNWFRKEYNSKGSWDWSLKSPYERRDEE